MPVQYVLSCPKVAGHSNGWSDIPNKKEANKKKGKKLWGEKEKKEEKGRKNKKRRKKGEVNKTKGKKGIRKGEKKIE